MIYSLCTSPTAKCKPTERAKHLGKLLLWLMLILSIISIIGLFGDIDTTFFFTHQEPYLENAIHFIVYRPKFAVIFMYITVFWPITDCILINVPLKDRKTLQGGHCSC